MPDNKDVNNNGQRYEIGAVARLTGLSTHTIRSWERRYEAVVADRSDNGRRRYSSADVEKLRLLKQLTDNGVAISTVANDEIERLRDQAREFGTRVADEDSSCCTIAVLGEELPSRLLDEGALAEISIPVSDHDKTRFLADLAHHDVDLIVLEVPVIEESTTDGLLEMLDAAGATGGILVYNFGTTKHVEHARTAGIITLRAPVDPDDIEAAARRAMGATRAPREPRNGQSSATEETAWQLDGEIPRRRFDRRQLARLSTASSTIECECPQHLCQLVASLTAFEIYSDQCENRDDQDAALHRYLHHATAQARSLIEAALERVALAEGLEY